MPAPMNSASSANQDAVEDAVEDVVGEQQQQETIVNVEHDPENVFAGVTETEIQVPLSTESVTTAPVWTHVEYQDPDVNRPSAGSSSTMPAASEDPDECAPQDTPADVMEDVTPADVVMEGPFEESYAPHVSQYEGSTDSSHSDRRRSPVSSQMSLEEPNEEALAVFSKNPDNSPSDCKQWALGAPNPAGNGGIGRPYV